METRKKGLRLLTLKAFLHHRHNPSHSALTTQTQTHSGAARTDTRADCVWVCALGFSGASENAEAERVLPAYGHRVRKLKTPRQTHALLMRCGRITPHGLE